jgi:hypothetical protein
MRIELQHDVERNFHATRSCDCASNFGKTEAPLSVRRLHQCKKSRNPLMRQAVLKVPSNETCFKLRETTRVLVLRNIEGLSQGCSLGNEVCHSTNMGAL